VSTPVPSRLNNLLKMCFKIRNEDHEARAHNLGDKSSSSALNGEFGVSAMRPEVLTYSVNDLETHHLLHVEQESRQILWDHLTDVHDLHIPLNVKWFAQMDTARRVECLTFHHLHSNWSPG